MKLPLTPKEALFLSVFVDQAWDTNITYQDLARHFGVRPVEILRENTTLKSLAEKEIILVRKNDIGMTSYRVHPKLVDMLLEEKLPEPKPTTGLTAYDFIDAVFDMLCLDEQGEMENDVLYENIRTLIEGNMHLNICPKLKELNLSNTNLKLLLYMAMLHINNHDFYVGPSDIDDAFSGRDLRRHVNELQEGSHELMNEANGHQKLVEYACKDGMASVNQISDRGG